MDHLASTLRALAAPRRSVPIALVVIALVGVQVLYGGEPRAALIPLGMAVGFVALAPMTWRVLLATPRTRALGLIGAVVYMASAVAVVGAFGIALPAALGLGPTFLTDAGSLAIAGVLYLVGGWGLGRDIELEHDLQHTRQKAIRTHFDPHFLYNTLNAIAEWCAEDPKVAEEATLRLAAMLRDILDGLEQHTWPLARELAVVEDLLELHRIRDADAFTVALEIDDAATRAAIPPLVLVSLVENAVKHGPRKGHRGVIAVRVEAIATGVRCTVENPGPYAPGNAGRGLATVRARLELAHRTRARFTIEAVADRTRAVLEVPA